ncbi:hypothetical protein PFISCL1PPCAC_10616 [Pristionchus fissidentatus]|uniref:PNPLA domain-containing protein n=1 Tax=Pristionchus fissidentatus TaxID=1538716 RepID=A0AAV5VLQ5_9BILA|nr:hypothetical protein PFISCL1PPCAC_10616 [Pristionchus fissidentatus]
MNFFKKLSKARKVTEEVVSALDEIMKNAPIFLAVASGNVDALCRGYADGECLTVVDLAGNNILHVAVQKRNRSMVRAVLVLSYDLQLWEKKNEAGKTPWDLATKELREDMSIFQSDKESKGFGCDWKRNTELVEEKMDMDDVSKEHVLLSLDGGGMKGLLELQTMLLIERRLGIPLMGVVDWIAGTSTGSLIALVLAQGRSVQWVHQLYFRLGSIIFKKGDSYVPKYSSKNLEECLIEHIGTAPLSSIQSIKVVVTCSKIETSPPSLLLLRSYLPRVPSAIYSSEGFLDPDRTPVWKAARCSSAAPIYFTSCNGLADGALCTNNPCAVLISDFYRIKKIENVNGVKNEDEIHCMISLGTGQDPRQAQPVDVSLQSFAPNALLDTIKKSTNLIQMFIMQCVSSDGPAVEYSKEWAHSQGFPFFRIQPLLDKKVQLDEKKPSVLMDILWQTEVHNRTRIPHQIDQIVELLRSIHTKRGNNNNLNPGAEKETEMTPRTESMISAREENTSSRRAK